ncbi:molybdenum-pterin-binding protein [Arcobacter suis]|uniref:Molybdenum-pterin binding domain-containing protein n=1 Tax=Arcobacter suis CECT 7833 TaxID=663365 RepID=A0AAD0SPA0_9BACT|nr:TOBE domain-containing protein [Arcobacter suis]AXX88535.1 molybdenum-pterin binding domain-containing protein [Arcobacter suis CECT 7833]RWS47631.1 molybdenum-pterin-binding protein [Arcobacter suis]
MKTSARNELTGKITNIIDGAVMSEVKITVSSEVTISATVTKEGIHSLGAKLNDNVTAIIKASSIIITKDAVKTTARNVLKGKVVEVIKGAINSEVKLSLGNSIISAVVTNDAIEDLSIKASEDAYAIFKASSVILIA